MGFGVEVGADVGPEVGVGVEVGAVVGVGVGDIDVKETVCDWMALEVVQVPSASLGHTLTAKSLLPEDTEDFTLQLRLPDQLPLTVDTTGIDTHESVSPNH